MEYSFIQYQYFIYKSLYHVMCYNCFCMCKYCIVYLLYCIPKKNLFTLPPPSSSPDHYTEKFKIKRVEIDIEKILHNRLGANYMQITPCFNLPPPPPLWYKQDICYLDYKVNDKLEIYPPPILHPRKQLDISLNHPGTTTTKKGW